METFFIFCLSFGVIWTLVSVLMGGLGGHGEAGHLEADLAHVDIDASGGHLDTTSAGDSGPAAAHSHPVAVSHSPGFTASLLSFLSPTVLAVFLTVLGGVGLIVEKVFGEEGGWILATVSLIIGFFVAVGAAIITRKFMTYLVRQGEKKSQPDQFDIVGQEAEVILAIPANGCGEIVYFAKDARYNASAKSEDGVPIQRSWIVRIVQIGKNGLHIVKPIGPKTETST